MTDITIAGLTVLIFVAAMLYSSVGHGGASAYLAVMALFGVAPAVMKPTALCLNIFVASVAAVKFYRAGHFSGRIFWPFAVGSIPFAFLGGYLVLPTTFYKPLVGVVLLYAAYWLFRSTQRQASEEVKAVSKPGALGFGIGIGLLSGLTGVGGGIFLSPLLLALRWATAKQTAAVSSLFIVVNSCAGLLGHMSSVAFLPRSIPIWVGAALLGGWLGAQYGSQHFGYRTLRRLLAVVLIVAGVKMILV